MNELGKNLEDELWHKLSSDIWRKNWRNFEKSVGNSTINGFEDNNSLYKSFSRNIHSGLKDKDE